MKFADFLNESLVEADSEYKLVYRQDLDGETIDSARRHYKAEIKDSTVADKVKVEQIEEVKNRDNEFELVVTGSKTDLEKLAKELDLWYQDYSITKK